MSRYGISGGAAAFLLLFGALLGAGGYYFFLVPVNGYVTSAVTIRSVSTTTLQGVSQTVTQSLTTTATQTLAVTLTETLTETPTQATSSVSTSTTTVYPAPLNVTLAFTNVAGEYFYAIQTSNSSSSGTEYGNYSVQLTGLYQGELLAITGTAKGAGGCSASEHFTMTLWLNGQPVAQTVGYCSGGSATIDYRV